MFLSLIPHKGPGTSGINLLVSSPMHRGKTYSLKKINHIPQLAHYASRVPAPRADDREAWVPENTKWGNRHPFQLGISIKTYGVALEIEMPTHRQLIHHQVKGSALVIWGVGQIADTQALLSMTIAPPMNPATKKTKKKNEILWAHELS